MKLIGSLENFQPSSLLQWFQTERAEGVLAVQGGPGYRLRFERGELVAAAHWPPGESLERRLRRSLGADRAKALRLEAEMKGLPLADLLVGVLGAEEAERLVASHAEGVTFRLLEERTGRFFFDPPACELPSSLRSRLNVSRMLLELARRQDEEERLAEWIPAATSPLRLARDPVPLDDTQSGLRGALVEGLREPRSRQQLEAMIAVESHAVRLKLAELIRSGNIEILPGASPGAGSVETSSASTPASVLHFAKSPSADDWPFLTGAEASLLEGLREGPRSLEEASRTLRRDRQELMPVAELLVDSGWIAVEDPPPSHRERPAMRALVTASVVAVALILAAVFIWTSLQGIDGPRDAGSTASGPAVESPAPVGDPASEGADDDSSRSQDEPAVPTKPDPEPSDPEQEEPKALADREPANREPANREPTNRVRETRKPVAPESGKPDSAVLETARIDESLREEIGKLRRALSSGDLPGARAALDKAAALRPGDPRLAELWRELQAASAPPDEAAEAEKPAPGKLMVNAIPYGFVSIDGEEKGTTPLNLELPPGDYEIRVYRAGYETIVRQVELESATVFLESFNLQPTEGEDRP